jgi:hypothetical protein
MARSLGVGRLLGRTFALWFRGLLLFSFLAALFFSPRILHRIATTPTIGPSHIWGTLLIDHLLLMPVVAGIVHAVLARLRGRPAGIGGCLKAALAGWLPAVGVTLHVHLLALLAALPFAILGGVLGIEVLTVGTWVAAIAVLCRYWLAIPVAVAERTGIGVALRRGVELARGSKWAIFAIVALFLAPWLVAVSVLAVKAETPSGLDTGLLILMAVRGTLMAVASTVAYHELKTMKEGAPTEDLVRVFA